MPAENVTIRAKLEAVDSPITVAETEHGTVTAPSNARYKDTVTLTVEPDSGFVLKALTVTDADGNDIEVTDCRFTMSYTAVTVTAEFDTESAFGEQRGKQTRSPERREQNGCTSHCC